MIHLGAVEGIKGESEMVRPSPEPGSALRRVRDYVEKQPRPALPRYSCTLASSPTRVTIGPNVSDLQEVCLATQSTGQCSAECTDWHVCHAITKLRACAC